jgi:hypothetical protein
VCYRARRSSNSDSLLAEPALRCFRSPLQDDCIALEAARHVVPCRGDKIVLATQVLKLLLQFGLARVSILMVDRQREARKDGTYRALL